MQETPYVQMHYGKNYTGNERFFGFCVDILARVAREVGFDYILDLVPDRKYGAKDPVTGEWNGMVAQLMKQVSGIEGSVWKNRAPLLLYCYTSNLGISIIVEPFLEWRNPYFVIRIALYLYKGISLRNAEASSERL